MTKPPSPTAELSAATPPGATPQPAQTLFPFLAPVRLLLQGGGEHLLKPAKPIQRLTIKEAATCLRTSVWTIYRLYHQGHITGDRLSPNGIRLHADSLQAHLQKTQDPDFWNP